MRRFVCGPLALPAPSGGHAWTTAELLVYGVDHPTFSNNKQTLFANVQSPGHVFAITGPFHKQR